MRREKTANAKCALTSEAGADNRNSASIYEKKAKEGAPNLFASLVNPTPVTVSSEAANTDTSAVDESDAADCIIIDAC